MTVPEALLLDLDGTLVSLNPPRDDLETLRSRMIQVATTSRVPVAHRGVFAVYARLYDALGADHPVVELARAIIDEHEVAWADTTAVALLDGTGRAALEQFPGQWGLVTNNGMAAVAALVKRDLLPGAYACAITRTAGLPLKPSPAPLAHASELTANSGEMWFIGDGEADQAAAAAFVRSTGAPLRFVRVANREINAVLRGLMERGGGEDWRG